VPGLVLVALAAARAVDHDLGARHRVVDPVPGGKVAGHGLDAGLAVAAAAAEDPDVVPGIPQPRDDEPPEGAGAARDQDGRVDASVHRCLHVTSVVSGGSTH
jgi:hypothetical protein